MEFIQKEEPDIKKPIIIAAMQDMGNVGSIVINFINKSLKSKPFRTAKVSFPTYVVDNGGHIDLPNESWEYKYTDDLIIFGGGNGQPQDNNELNLLCKDVMNVAEKYSAKFIYTLGGFHTNRVLKNIPKTYVTTTSLELRKQMEKLELDMTPQKSLITGFNGLILGYAKLNGINGIGLYGELLEPRIPQYRAARTIIETLEKLTYQKLGDTKELSVKAEAVESRFGSEDDIPKR